MGRNSGIMEYNIPFFSSQMWKWVVDDRLEQSLWTAAVSSGDYIHKIINKSDLILSVWYDVIEKPTNILWVNWIEVVHINFESAIIDNVYFPTLEVIWDIANTFWQLYVLWINTTKWNFREIYLLNKKNKNKLEINLKNEMNSIVMMPRRFTKELRETLWEKDILTLDNWLYKVWIARNYDTYNPNTVLLDNALATMWAWFASAMTAKMLNKNQKVVCVTWDWGFLMNLWDYETAVRLKLDITIIVLNNSEYWMIKWKQKAAWFVDFWLDFTNPDFVKFAESFKTKWYKVTKASDFKEILKTAINSKWINLIDLKFDYPVEIK